MPTELEAKLKVDDHDAVRAALIATSAERIGRVREVNYIFDHASDPLAPRGMALRVRSIDVRDGDHAGATMTFKGPAKSAAFKTREEIEVGVADAARAVEILEAVGFETALLYEKDRETWRLGNCLVELDTLPVLGRFVEIEGPSVEQIAAVRQQLGLDSATNLKRGYVAMLAEHCATARLTPRHIRFAP